MEEPIVTAQPSQTPTPETGVENTTPVPVPEVPVAEPAKKWNKVYLGAGGIALLMLTGVVYLLASRSASPEAPDQPAAQPTPLATATPVQQVSAISTSSAFLTFTENIASLSAKVNAFSIQDGALTPPALDLEIGFSRE